MTWLQTRSARAFDFARPSPDEIEIEDIAHALGHTCRFLGHSRAFYSVGEHSVHVAALLMPAGRHLARWGLLHDAHEAYVGDVPSPLKRLLPEYRRLEHIAGSAVRLKFGLVGPVLKPVKAVDAMILQFEAAALCEPPPRPWEKTDCSWPAGSGSLALGWQPPCWSPLEARDRFLSLFSVLFPEHRRVGAARGGR